MLSWIRETLGPRAQFAANRRCEGADGGTKGGAVGGHNRSHPKHLLPGSTDPGRTAGVAGPVGRLEPGPADLLAGLTGRGRAFVERCWTEYAGWTPASLALLHEAGRLLAELETLRGQRGERAAQRLLLSVLAALEHAR